MASRNKGGGSARGKDTDLTAKKGGPRAIQTDRTNEGAPVKAGRNMGGRSLTGERVRGPQGKAGR